MATKRAPARGHAPKVKRVYDPPAADDGARVLVDRLWPRGITKEKAALDEWLRDVAPSDALRKRVHSGEASYDEFVRAYAAELEREPAKAAAASLRARLAEGPVTLLFAAKDEARNNAVALAAWLAHGG
jgi:uncharacterized protein YeaO (DUF488 family)